MTGEPNVDIYASLKLNAKRLNNNSTLTLYGEMVYRL